MMRGLMCFDFLIVTMQQNGEEGKELYDSADTEKCGG